MTHSLEDPRSGAALTHATVDGARILRSWWPLAASWLLMGAELPLVAAVVARMEAPELNLAAYGSLVFPLALAIEAPIIMLLAASTALCVDAQSYRAVRRFMLAAGALLTLVHATVAWTPIFDHIAVQWIGAPPELIEPGRVGLQILTPWTWSIAYRRFQQGVLIRCERARLVSLGTLVRLGANIAVLALGWSLGRFSGVVVGASAVTAGVMAEAVFIGACVQPVLRARVLPAAAAAQPLTARAFAAFYVPLALVPLVTLLGQPIGASAMARMDEPMNSLATWPAFHGLLFLTRALGLSFNEVVVALVGAPRGVAELSRFAHRVAWATSGVMLAIALTPLSAAWFRGWSHLGPELERLGSFALLLAAPLPALNVWQSLYQGALVRARRTRAATEATLLSLATTCVGLCACVLWSRWPGLACAAAMLVLGNLVQTLWLRWRARDLMRESGSAA